MNDFPWPSWHCCKCFKTDVVSSDNLHDVLTSFCSCGGCFFCCIIAAATSKSQFVNNSSFCHGAAVVASRKGNMASQTVSLSCGSTFWIALFPMVDGHFSATRAAEPPPVWIKDFFWLVDLLVYTSHVVFNWVGPTLLGQHFNWKYWIVWIWSLKFRKNIFGLHYWHFQCCTVFSNSD